MEKIGKVLTFVIFAVLFLNGLFTEQAFAQNNITVEATVSEATVYEGSRIKLNVTISGDFNEIALPELPDLQGFRLISTTPSTSRRFSYINGVSKTSYTYSYFIEAQQSGNYAIPPISIEIDSKKYTTKPIQVAITKRSGQSADKDSSADIYLKLEIADQTVVPGEQIIANVVLYFKNNIQVQTYQPVPGWKAQGFWKEQLNNSTRPEVNSLTINGMRYNKARLLRFALFATKTGELTVSPFQVNVLVASKMTEQNLFSNFFGSFGSNRRQLELETEPVTIKVNSLPSDSSDYIGAVGSFTIQRKISADTVEVGETLEIKTTISGTGNIPLLTNPDYNLPAGLEVYTPQSEMQINRNGSRIKGSKIFTDVVVPRNAGRITIPSTTLAWYNPAKGAFVKKELPARTVFVKAGRIAATGASGRGDVAISPITGLVNWVTPASRSLAGYWWFWVGLILPAIILGVTYWKKTYNDKMSTDSGFARSQQAVDAADARLQNSIDHAENDRLKQAYNSLQKALTGFIADKTGMPEAGLSIEQYIEKLEERGVNEDLIKNVKMLLNKCATINYAPDASAEYLKSHVGLAESIIKKLRKEL